MNADKSIAIMKALADKSRLSIVNSLLESSQYMEEIAKRHDLAPSTVSFHLRKLEQAGLVSSRKEQYYVVIRANQEIFNTTLREIVSAHPVSREHQNSRMEEYRRKVLESFFREGRLEKLPAQRKKRLIILEQFALRFEPGRSYSEREVTALIMPVFDDYCTIRRLLVDEGLIRRNGAQYLREEGKGAPAKKLSWPEPKTKEAEKGKMENKRAEMKRIYKQNQPSMGVYQILNTVNGRIFLAAGRDLESARNSRLFQLRMGKAVFSTELQKDLKEFGAEKFEFSILQVLEKTERENNVERALAELEAHWLEKLQPFGERGYNSEKAYRRTKERLEIVKEAEPL